MIIALLCLKEQLHLHKTEGHLIFNVQLSHNLNTCREWLILWSQQKGLCFSPPGLGGFSLSRSHWEPRRNRLFSGLLHGPWWNATNDTCNDVVYFYPALYLFCIFILFCTDVQYKTFILYTKPKPSHISELLTWLPGIRTSENSDLDFLTVSY